MIASILFNQVKVTSKTPQKVRSPMVPLGNTVTLKQLAVEINENSSYKKIEKKSRKSMKWPHSEWARNSHSREKSQTEPDFPSKDTEVLTRQLPNCTFFYSPTVSVPTMPQRPAQRPSEPQVPVFAGLLTQYPLCHPDHRVLSGQWLRSPRHHQLSLLPWHFPLSFMCPTLSSLLGGWRYSYPS